MDIPSCPECEKQMERQTRSTELRYEKFTATIELPGWYCACGESLHDGRDMTVSDRALNILKARANDLLEPEYITQIRKRLKLSQRKAGEILGGGPNAFHKYEKGDVLVSKAVSNLLRVLNENPKMLSVILPH
ncbi:MAG: type II toxin-antitoxin system MqsA family antitoxin [Magnetococcales bacterium]|nr:type II toxin-antitoxin system MqsA family antitoxin [Magnetococcales bacterium]